MKQTHVPLQQDEVEPVLALRIFCIPFMDRPATICALIIRPTPYRRFCRLMLSGPMNCCDEVDCGSNNVNVQVPAGLWRDYLSLVAMPNEYRGLALSAGAWSMAFCACVARPVTRNNGWPSACRPCRLRATWKKPVRGWRKSPVFRCMPGWSPPVTSGASWSGCAATTYRGNHPRN